MKTKVFPTKFKWNIGWKWLNAAVRWKQAVKITNHAPSWSAICGPPQTTKKRQISTESMLNKWIKQLGNKSNVVLVYWQYLLACEQTSNVFHTAPSSRTFSLVMSYFLLLLFICIFSLLFFEDGGTIGSDVLGFYVSSEYSTKREVEREREREREREKERENHW